MIQSCLMIFGVTDRYICDHLLLLQLKNRAWQQIAMYVYLHAKISTTASELFKIFCFTFDLLAADPPCTAALASVQILLTLTLTELYSFSDFSPKPASIQTLIKSLVVSLKSLQLIAILQSMFTVTLSCCFQLEDLEKHADGQNDVECQTLLEDGHCWQFQHHRHIPKVSQLLMQWPSESLFIQSLVSKINHL